MRKAERGERLYRGHGGHEHPGDGVRSKAHAQILHPVSRVRNVQMNCNELQRKGLFGSSELGAAPAIRHVTIRNETTHTKRDPARAGLCCNECEEPAAMRAAAHDFAVCWNRAESPITVNVRDCPRECACLQCLHIRVRITTRFCKSARTPSRKRFIACIVCWHSAIIRTTRKRVTRNVSVS